MNGVHPAVVGLEMLGIAITSYGPELEQAAGLSRGKKARSKASGLRDSRREEGRLRDVWTVPLSDFEKKPRQGKASSSYLLWLPN